MGTVKVLISEKDGVEFEYSSEMDLLDALAYVGASIFDEDKILTDHNYQVLVDFNGNVLRED